MSGPGGGGSGFEPSNTNTPFLTASNGLTVTGSVEFANEVTFNGSVQLMSDISIKAPTPFLSIDSTGAGQDCGLTLSENGTDHWQFKHEGSNIDNSFVIRDVGAANVLVIEDNSGADKIHINSTGVGISAADPVSLLEVRGPTGTGADCAGVLTISTAETSIAFGDVLGKLNFQASKESDGTDATAVAAAIEAHADLAFDAASNFTNLIFKTGESGAAAQKMKLDYDGLLTINHTTGLHGVEIQGKGTFRRGSERFYLEEFFSKRPQLNATINAAHTTEAARNANEHFEILGRTDGSHTIGDANVYWHAKTGTNENAGLTFSTSGVAGDQCILTPHLDTQSHFLTAQASTAWSGIAWNSSKEVEWECAVTTGPDVTAQGFWAGLGEDPPGDASWSYTTDDDQAFFFACADDTFGALTTNANLHFVYSVGGTDYITNLGIAMEDNTLYRFRIRFGSNRKMKIFVNDQWYAITLTDTGTTAGGVTESSNFYSAAMTADKALIPYVGIQALGATNEAHQVHYMKMSRVIGYT